MSRRVITNFCAIPTALFLVIIGILHAIVNVSGFRRAIGRGEIAAASIQQRNVRRATWLMESKAVQRLPGDLRSIRERRTRQSSDQRPNRFHQAER